MTAHIQTDFSNVNRTHKDRELDKQAHRQSKGRPTETDSWTYRDGRRSRQTAGPTEAGDGHLIGPDAAPESSRSVCSVYWIVSKAYTLSTLTESFPFPHLPLSLLCHFTYFSIFTPSVPFDLTVLLHTLSLLASTRSALCVLRRVGLRPRGTRSRWGGDHHHGDLHHDDGPRPSHPAEVRVPRSS